MRAFDVVKLFNPGTYVIVRRAFGDDEGVYYEGHASTFSESHTYANREVMSIFPYKTNKGDVARMEDADALDITVSDFNDEEYIFVQKAIEKKMVHTILN